MCVRVLSYLYNFIFSHFIIIFIIYYLTSILIYLQVGKETINSSDDALLKQDMPAALQRVEGASRLLEEASAMLKKDPYSGPAR